MSLWEMYKAKRLGYADDLWTSLIGHRLGGYSWISTDYEETPYIYRAMPNMSHYYNREIMEEVVGGTVAWNQLVKNGNFANTNNWSGQYCSISASGNVLTAEATAENVAGRIEQAVTLIAGHKYLFKENIKVSANATSRFAYRYSGGVKYTASLNATANTWGELATVFSADTQGDSGMLYLYYSNSTALAVGGTAQHKDVMLFDLTLALGSTIADYVYSLEQSNAGAGVAFFKTLFPKPYYAYNAGELMSVKGLVSHDMVGFNAFDKSTVVDNKYINGLGVEASDNGMAHSDYIPVVPNTTYYTNADATGYYYTVVLYDADKNFIKRTNTFRPETFNTEDAHYIIVNTKKSFTSVDELVVNLSWDGSEDGNYEPYQKWSYPLDSDLELRGKFKLDANNNLYADGDVYPPSGQVQRKWSEEITFDGSSDEGWSMPATGYFAIAVSNLVDDNSKQTIISDRYLGNSWASITGVSLDMAVGVVNGATIRFRNSAITSLNDWKTWLSNNNTTVVYELATPTTETAQPFTKTQKCDSGGTEEFVTSGIVSVGHKSKYAEK